MLPPPPRIWAAVTPESAQNQPDVTPYRGLSARNQPDISPDVTPDIWAAVTPDIRLMSPQIEIFAYLLYQLKSALMIRADGRSIWADC